MNYTCGRVGGVKTFKISKRDFVTVAVTPNFDNLEIIFFKSPSFDIHCTQLSFLLFLTSV